MSKPSYLALRYFQHYVAANPSEVGKSPEDLLADAILTVLDRMLSDEIRAWVTDVFQVLHNPSAQDLATARSFDDAETRFLDVLVRGGRFWEMNFLMNNLGKVGNDLGFKVPFLF